MQISEAWALICELSVATGATKIAQQNGCWEYAMQPWYIFLNPHDNATRCTHDILLPGYTAYIEFKGRPMGFLSPDGGMIVKAFKVNEAILIAALRKRINEIRKSVLRDEVACAISCQAI